MPKGRSAPKRNLTAKQLKFIAFYDGNGVEAARRAGYTGDDNVLGCIAYENLRKPRIRAAIQKRTEKDIEPVVATRLARQKFWSNVLADPKSQMKDRLKASELLGKSEADFIDVVKSNSLVKTEVRIVNEEQVGEWVKKFEDEF